MRTDKKNFSTRLMTALMAGTLALGMLGTTAFAEGANQTETTSVVSRATLTKKITKRAEVYSPAASFTFTITPGTAVAATSTTNEIKAGPAGGVTFGGNATSTTIESTPVLSDGQSTTVITVGSKDLQVNDASFKDTNGKWKPGIYRYNIAESVGNYEGITYDATTRYFDVYVTNNGIVSKSFMNVNNPKVKDDGIITNDYDKNHEGEINDLTIKKELAGNMPDDSEEFEFTVTINGNDNEKYNVIYSDGKTTGTITSKTPATIKLKGGQSVKITGLSHSDTYKVEEKDYTAQGYKTTYDANKKGKISVDTTTTVINEKNAPSPTGVVLNYGPYILMIALAGSMAVFFLRKKNRKEA